MADGGSELWVWWSPHALGGVENFLLGYAERAAAHHSLIAIAGIRTIDGPLEGRYPQGAIILDWSRFYPAFIANDPSARSVTARIADELQSCQPSLLSLNGCSAFGTGAIPLLQAIRRFTTIVDVFHADVPDARFYEERKPYVHILDGVVSSSRSALDRFAALSKRAATIPSTYIPYGVDLPMRERRPPGNKLRIVVVGRLAREQKRVHLLPAIFARLASFGRDFEALIIGEGPDRMALEAELAAAGVADRVHLAGYRTREETIDASFEHDVIVNCSDYEGFPISVIEALAAGCVPVCTDLPSRDGEILRDGETCMLVPIDAAERIADVCASLTVEDIRRMSEAGRKEGTALTQERMWQRYHDFFAVLRAHRPIEEWKRGASVALDWNPAVLNPWIPRRFGTIRNLLRNRRGGRSRWWP